LALISVAGLNALVTGAASGIGWAITLALAEEGAAVTLVDVDAQALQTRIRELRIKGYEADAAVCDIGSAGAVADVIDGVVARQGRIDVLFANAGVSAGPGFKLDRQGALEGDAGGRWNDSLKINLTGTYRTIAAAARHMKAARRGSIIVTSSISALKASPVSAYAYIAAKAALNAIVRQAATELGPYNVRINAIAPGFVRTGLGGGRLNDVEFATTLAATVPLGRIAQPEDLMGIALLLASPAASYITGTVIPVDGGVTGS
jgi:NAD(P)-dependent dehydrogenase (short-subunit alcohol dehydrogenase family)